MATQAGKVSRFVEVDVVVTGSQGFRVDGYDDGTSISCAPQGDRVTVRPGNDGKDTFAETSSRHWIVTLSLLESSDSNDELSRWLESGLTQGVSFIDKAGRTVVSSSKARVRQYSPVTKSAGVETRSWDIHCLATQAFVGGLNQ
jgi:hypothetical protein